MPDKKWRRLLCKAKDNQPNHIGFHITEPKFAIDIAHSDFFPSKKGWVGRAAYFARSIDGCEGKYRSKGGARIIAEIHMGKVYEIEREVKTKTHARFDTAQYAYVHYGKWQEDYDTCYMVQEHKNREEFAIKNPASQIIKWAIVIERPHDHKVAKYQLDTEFDSPLCDCF